MILAKYRYIGFLIMLGIAFVGIVASLKTVEVPNNQSVAAVKQDYDDGSEPLSIEQSFYISSSTRPTKEVGGDNTPVPEAEPIKPLPPQLAPDEVAADAYLVGDVSTGKIYLEKNAGTILPFASMSKLVTAIIATQKYKTTDVIEVLPVNTTVPSDETGIHAGEKFSVNELLYPLLLESSNISAEALATHMDRIKFLEAMSSFAWSIGMPKSYFADPTGLDAHNAGTANGFFALAKYLYKERPDILAITRTQHQLMATTTIHDSHDLTSIHPFVNDPRFLGGKTGHTKYALDTLFTLMNIQGHPVAIIILHSPYMRERDTNILIDKVSTMIAEGN